MFYADLRGTQAASSKKNDDQHLRVYFSSICGCLVSSVFFSSGPMRKLLEASESSGEKKDAGSQHIMLFKILNTWHEISFWNHSNFLTDRSMYIFFGFLFGDFLFCTMLNHHFGEICFCLPTTKKAKLSNVKTVQSYPLEQKPQTPKGISVSFGGLGMHLLGMFPGVLLGF